MRIQAPKSHYAEDILFNEDIPILLHLLLSKNPIFFVARQVRNRDDECSMHKFHKRSKKNCHLAASALPH